MEAFSNLIIRFEQDLYRIASIRLKNADDIDDVIQMTIEQTLKNIKKLKNPQYIKTWIIKILINNCNAIYKRKRYKMEYNENIELNVKSDNDDVNSKLDFYILIKNLNEKEKLAITLYYSENLTTKEISKILKEPESTIRNRISRAINKLRNKYREDNMVNKDNESFENNLKRIFTEEIEVPYCVKNKIRTVLNDKKERKNRNRLLFNTIKILATVTACFIITTGVVFAKDIYNFINNFFINNEGMDNAIEQGYIDKPNMEYVESNGTEIKINKALMDDYNLSLEFNMDLNKKIKAENIEDVYFPDMIITDENNNILYCEDQTTFESYCKNNNLKYTWKETNENYINSGSNKFIKANNGDTIKLVYNFYASKYPKSKKILINLNKILCSYEEKDIIINGNWQIEYKVPEKFYNREAYIYTVKNCTSDKIRVEEVTVTETTTKMIIQTDEKPSLPYELTDDEETKNRKIQEELEREKNMTIEDFEKSKKFKNEYIENEKGEKFYPTISTSDDTGYSFIDTSYLLHWQTFNLNKYNATTTLKIYMNYNREDIVIELERKDNEK